jgi:hypothetical protein
MLSATDCAHRRGVDVMVPKMSPAVIPEELIASEPALPAQFHEIWHKTRYVSPERALVLALVWQAIIDLRKYRFASRRRQQRLYMEAYRWVVSDDRHWPYAFCNVAEMLDVAPERLRTNLLGDIGAADDARAEVEEAA